MEHCKRSNILLKMLNGRLANRSKCEPVFSTEEDYSSTCSVHARTPAGLLCVPSSGWLCLVLSLFHLGGQGLLA